MKRKKHLSKIIFFTAILIVISFISASAQVMFQKTFGDTTDNWGRYAEVINHPDGYAIIGFTQVSPGNKDIYFLQLDTCGNNIADRKLGGNRDDLAYVVERNTSGDYVMVGTTQSYGAGDFDMYLPSINGNNYNANWSATIGDTLRDRGEYFQQTTDGGYIITGRTKSYGKGGWDVYLVKLSATHSLQWARTYGDSADDRGYALQQTTDGGYILVGGTNSYGQGSSDVYVVKTNSVGVVAWTRVIGGKNYDEAYGVKQTNDSGYIITGKTLNTDTSHSSLSDIYLVKLASNGNLQWVQSYGGMREESGEHVIQVGDSGYVIAGYTKSFGHGDYDACLLKVDQFGTLQWNWEYGGEREDKSFSVEQTYDDGFIVCGHTKSFGAGGFDVYVIKTDPFGRTSCMDSIGFFTYYPPDSVAYGAYVDSGAIVLKGLFVDSLPTITTILCSTCDTGYHRNELFMQEGEEGLNIFPNPATNELTITVSNVKKENVILKIYNNLGILIYQKQIIESEQSLNYLVDVKNLNNGIYFLSVTSTDNIQTKKIVIMK